ncbi:AMP-binding protein [Mumia zhuanghuii]|uniref:AMP-binding protein n=2 Tax=Mumia TaxID=1546255 RepID=A0ABW1QQY5_9ACTN|nr:MULTISPECIES: AMP-binding protein [Mumia]KAA1420552.1 AMP-binding protein [Mumia zhuanghuii]
MSGPTWFTRPGEDTPGRLNLAYDALDRQVVAGRADEPALRAAADDLSYAVLLERVAAFGGLLGALGVRVGHAVAVPAAVSVETAVAVLAAARIGATVWIGGEVADVVRRSDAGLVVADGPQMADVVAALETLDPVPPRAVVVVRAGEWAIDETRDVAWEPALKAGATDPATVVPVDAGAPLVTTPAEDAYAVHTHAELAADAGAGVPDGPVEVPLAATWTAALVGDLLTGLQTGRSVVLRD